jgi:hypothetical protein
MTKISTGNRHYLAVVNMAWLKPDADPQELAGFKAAADPFMGRVLRDNSALRAFVDPRESDLGDGIFSSNETMTNLTVWETPQDLLLFLRDAHQAVYRRYRELFAPMVGQAAVALWWTPEDHTPDYVEAESRLIRLREVGPTEYAFDFATVDDFPAPS